MVSKSFEIITAAFARNLPPVFVKTVIGGQLCSSGEGASHSRAQYLQQGPCGPQSLKYLPSVPLQKKLIDSCYRR